jgi:hypothetical protein
MRPVRHFITDFGEAQTLHCLDAGGRPTGETRTLPRYGVWADGGGHRKAEVIECGDDLAALCAKYGVEASSVIALPTGRTQAEGGSAP